MPRDGIRYGVQIACAAMHWPECLEITQAAEQLGYASVWVPDHYTATPDGLTPDIHLPLLDGWVTLAALAQATRSVRLGPLVASATFRHPGVLAKLAATVDHVSGGRLELGLGAGWFEFEHSSLGIPFPPIGTRLRQLEETIRIVRALWSQPSVDFDGEFFQLRGAVSEPKPLQKPMPPFVIGAQGEKVGLRNVARYADHWNTYCPVSAYPGKVAALRRHCEAEKRDFGSIQRSIMMPLYLEEDELVRNKLASWGRMVRAQGDAVRDWFLVGSEAEIRGRIDRFVAEGVDTLIVQVDRRSGNARTLERFAKTFMR
jgi:F420-dependent oxidoreductase-like protein